MITWQRGRGLVTARRESMDGSLQHFVDDLTSHPSRAQVVHGTAIFLNRGRTAPWALRANVEHNHVRHAHVAVVSVETETIPRVSETERVKVAHLGHGRDGITHVTVRFGYTETPDIPAALGTLSPEDTEGRLDLENATYFLSHIELRQGDEPGMATWRKRLFIATAHITADAAEHFGLPRDRTILLGSHIEV
jgi:KUP system potassium uptake protein